MENINNQSEINKLETFAKQFGVIADLYMFIKTKQKTIHNQVFSF